MPVVRSTLRTLKLFGYFLRFGTELALRRPRTAQAGADWLHRLCATALRGLGLQVTVQGDFPARGALVSNHLGYLDIVVMAALHPCVFVSKAEIEHWPLLGWFARMSGTVFVERGKGGSAARAEAGMRAASAAGLPVVFFPEGTTTDGDTMLPFRSGVLSEVLAAGQPVTAAFLAYTLTPGRNGPGVTVQNDVCYWQDGTIVSHIFHFLGLRGVQAHLCIAPAPTAFTTPEDRKQSASEAQQAVLALSLRPIPIATPPRAEP